MSLTVTAAAEWTSYPRVLVTVSSSPSEVDRLTLWRYHPDGTRHRVITNLDTLIGTFAGFDYHAPFNTSVTYRAAATSGLSAVSPATMVPSLHTWLIHPADPSLSLRVTLGGPPGEYTLPDTAIQSQVLGRQYPSFRTTGLGRGGRAQTLQIVCKNQSEENAVMALLADSGGVLMNSVQDSVPWMWIKPFDVQVSYPKNRARTSDLRLVSFAYAQMTQPGDSALPAYTSDQLAADYATSNAAKAAFSTAARMSIKAVG